MERPTPGLRRRILGENGALSFSTPEFGLPNQFVMPTSMTSKKTVPALDLACRVAGPNSGPSLKTRL